jgi:hypothetical protein
MEFRATGGFETKVWNHGLARPGAYIVQVTTQGQEQWGKTSRLLIFSGLQE